MSRTFQPAWWLPGPHGQTLWAALVRRRARPPLERERVELPDGDFVDLDWAAPRADLRPDPPIVLVLHGLEGSSDSRYARGMLAALARAGWRAAMLHFRGCSGSPNRLARSYHSGDTGDLAFVIGALAARFPCARLGAVGFSLGGNVLLKWLGETADANPLRVAAAVSVPFALGRCADRLEQGFSRAYQWWLMRSMRSSVLAKAPLLADRLDLDRARRSRSFREFDDRVTAPLHGFASADDYYARSSSRGYLRAIAVPTLIVHARDDPFMYPEVVPEAAEVSPAVRLAITGRGGHVGFVEGAWPGRARYWLEEAIPDFLRPYLTGERERAVPDPIEHGSRSTRRGECTS